MITCLAAASSIGFAGPGYAGYAGYAGFFGKPPEYFSLFPIEHYPQQLSAWINPAATDYDQLLLTPKQQAIRQAEFYRHYFGEESPWHPDYIQRIFTQPPPQDLKTLEAEKIDTFSNQNKPADQSGYGANFRPYTQQWLERIKHNINLQQLANQRYESSRRAIATNNLHGRLLPTEEVWFHGGGVIGRGYPFDLMQAAGIWAGTPLYILAQTRDHGWLLVLTPRFIAWVKSTGVARVDNAFVKKWTAAAQKGLVAVTNTQIPVVDTEDKIFRFSAYIGMVFPQQEAELHHPGRDLNHTSLLIPVRSRQGQAQMHHAQLLTRDATSTPLPATIRHVWTVMSRLIGRPYGWGSLYFYNDCAAELKNLYTPFGIWLPVHSSNQVDPQQTLGTALDLSQFDMDKRLAVLGEQGHRFMTIVYIGGHVLLYLGQYPAPNDPEHAKVILSYQNIWGLRPKAGPDRRAVIGQAVLFPLLKAYPEDTGLLSLAARDVFQLINLDVFPEALPAPGKIDLRSLLSP